jgi:hypothetical protein
MTSHRMMCLMLISTKLVIAQLAVANHMSYVAYQLRAWHCSKKIITYQYYKASSKTHQSEICYGQRFDSVSREVTSAFAAFSTRQHVGRHTCNVCKHFGRIMAHLSHLPPISAL